MTSYAGNIAFPQAGLFFSGMLRKTAVNFCVCRSRLYAEQQTDRTSAVIFVFCFRRPAATFAFVKRGLARVLSPRGARRAGMSPRLESPGWAHLPSPPPPPTAGHQRCRYWFARIANTKRRRRVWLFFPPNDVFWYYFPHLRIWVWLFFPPNKVFGYYSTICVFYCWKIFLA